MAAGGSRWCRAARGFGLAALALAAAPSTRAAASAGEALVERARFVMGTRLVVQARGEDAERAIERAFAEVDRLDAVLSNWRADSEVTRLNAAAAGGPFRCSPDLFAAATVALDWAERTGGTFDPTVEPLVRALGLRGDEGRLPGVPPEPEAAGPGPVGWRLVEVDRSRRTLRYRRPGMGLDFGGIGKGIALDAAAAVLRRAGVTAALLDFGGQALVFGTGPDEGGWRLGLADPVERDRVAGSVLLRAGSLAVSGNSERSRTTASGEKVPHLLDPATGRPASFDGTVSVIAPDATSADALSKAFFVMGPERGLAWATSRGLDVLYLRRDGDGLLRRRGRGAFLPDAPDAVPPQRPAPKTAGAPSRKESR
jgi:thiamine biosynthesis lipoprotein